MGRMRRIIKLSDHNRVPAPSYAEVASVSRDFLGLTIRNAREVFPFLEVSSINGIYCMKTGKIDYIFLLMDYSCFFCQRRLISKLCSVIR